MSKKYYFLALLCLLFCSAEAKETESVGFANFKKCIELSKQGLGEKNALEALKKQMNEALQKTDKELEETAKKLEDRDYMDGLSPTAEEELKQRFQLLSQEFTKYQNQCYQILNQANMRMLQSLHESVCTAAEVVRKKNQLKIILNEDSAFAWENTLDYTNTVVQEMDLQFELENNKQKVDVENNA